MQTKILLTIIAFGFLAGCGKDSYNTKPQLTYKKVNTKVLNRDESLTFSLEVTDAEGDIQDTIWIQKVVQNCTASEGIASYPMPNIPKTKNLKGEIQVCYSYGVNLGCPAIIEPKCRNKNDSAVYKFWIKDKAKNVSDTVQSDLVVLVQK